MMPMTYTGVGSRKTPGTICAQLDFLAIKLRRIGYRCRTGEADGADAAFRDGAGDDCDVFTKEMTTEASMAIAKAHHPAWHKVSYGASQLLGRNPFQVLGAFLLPEHKSQFLLCYTEDGKDSGGTGTTIRIANTYKVPVFNLFYPNEEDALWAFVKRMG